MVDGSIVAWGGNGQGQCDIPEPNADFIAVGAGYMHSIALKSNGDVIGWAGSLVVPNDGFVAAAAGGEHTLGLMSDGSVRAWGSNEAGQCRLPTPNEGFVTVGAGAAHNLALRTDGSILAWGSDAYGQCAVPEPNGGFSALAAGWLHSLAVRSDGSVACWGRNDHGQCDPPTPNSDFVAIAAGWCHGAGLRSDGTIACWGLCTAGECDIPEPTADIITIAGGGWHGAAVRGSQPTAIQITDASADVRERDVLLRWRTPLDLASRSFNVYRRGGETEGDIPISDDGRLGRLLTPDPLISRDGTYEYVDADVLSHRDYQYHLEMLGDGAASEVVHTFLVHVGRLQRGFRICRVIPHPVRGPAMIVVEIPERGHVSLDLLDVRGRRVLELFDGELNEGVQSVWMPALSGAGNGTQLAAGVYYALLRFKGRSKSKQVVVMR